MNKILQCNIKQNTRSLLVSLLVVCISFIELKVNAQCTNPDLYGSVNAPLSGTTTIDLCNYYGEYSEILNVQGATIYECGVVAGGFVTIRSGSYNGPVVASGSSPLTWTSNNSGTYFAHWNANSSCGIGTTCQETYIKFIGASATCTGTPTPGSSLANGIASLSSICNGVPLTLTLNGSVFASGLSFQWQSSSTGASSSYTAIVGATSSTYSIPSYSSFFAKYYRCLVTCGTSSALSNPVNVVTSSFTNCYCSSSASYSTDEDIINFTLNGASTNPLYANLNGCFTPAPGGGSVLNQYSNFKTLGSLTTLTKGLPASFSIHVDDCDNSPYYTFGASVWIDYNRNGSFNDPGENVYLEATETIGPRTISGTITAPTSSQSGVTAMRITVAESYAGAALTPCLQYGYGETEDYLINIVAGTPCSGTPNPGSAVATPSSVCLGSSLQLSLQNIVPGTGVTYQWYNNAGIIIGGTTPTYTIPSFTGPDDYYCNVTCGSGAIISSGVVSVGLNTYTNCYCSPNSSLGTSGGYYGMIASTQFNTLSNSSNFPVASPYYTDYSSLMTTNVMQGITYPMNIGVGSFTKAAVWIDWDHSGVFETNEFINLGANLTYVNPTNLSQLITVPSNAVPGATKVRIRGEAYFYNLNSNNSCTTLSYGESEDYMINVVAAPPCNGTPIPGNTIASASSVCAGTTVTFTLQHDNLGTGIAYQWYNNGSIISGATNSYYSSAINTAASYSCLTTCLNSGMSATSTPASIVINAPTACYCTPIYTVGKVDGDLIAKIEVLGTALSNTTGSSTFNPSYTYYQTSPSGIPANMTASLNAASSYTVAVTFGSFPNGGQNAAAWIDYNDDGVFSIAERIGYTTAASVGANGLVNFPITVSCSAPLGSHRLRVRDVFDVAGSLIDPCASYVWGETEDYDITITTSLSCSQPNTLSASAITSSGVTLSWAAGCTETLWDVHITTAGGGSPSATPSDANVTNPLAKSGLSASTAYEFWVRAKCGGIAGNSAWSGPYAFTTGVGGNSTLHLTCFIQGYWDAVSAMQPVLANQFEPTTPNACDSILVSLHDQNAPYAMQHSAKAVLSQNGAAQVLFPPLSGSYYIAVSHRNTIETWSANPVNFNSPITTYNFSTAASQAFGDNQIEITPGIYAMYSGDVVKDAGESTDLLDLAQLETDINNFGSGYMPTDLNGDGNVDILDTAPLENNATNFIFTSRP